MKNPVTGTRELSLLSPEEERRIGRVAAAEVEATVGLVNDKMLTPYVRSLGAELAAESPRQDVAYQFDIVDMVEPNAFALPDGHIYVSRGILALTNSEAELAGIVGHEIGHVAARHANQRFSRAAPVGVLAGLTSAVVGVVSSSAAQSIAGFGAGLNEMILAPHSRDQERQADQVGQDLAAKAGFDPSGLSVALDSLGRMDRYQHGVQQTSWLDSHPATAERVAETRTHAGSLRVAHPKLTDRAAYVTRQEGLLLGANAAYGLFEQRVFVHPELLFSVEFPKGWCTENSRKLVGGQAPDGDALCFLGVMGEGRSAVQAAHQFSEALEVHYQNGVSESQLNGNRAASAELVSDDVRAELTFVAKDGLIYQLIALTTPQRHAHFAPLFAKWVKSFDRPSPEQLAKVTEVRLSIVKTSSPDTLSAVLARHQQSSDRTLVAILNGMASPSAPLPGALLKLPVRVRYSAKR